MMEIVALLEGVGILGFLLYMSTKLAVINNHSGLILDALGRLERKE